ncbi:hypothetical protein F0L68_33630 [Solihabitans fulvus]|uniref:Uncharacterized protein n=1 Tax=Solihabitans fulvus TaxID=1892852 RepID=A0A5B2WM66_9PSEU|nr:LxmA leader domain family RiPP [Solihabitans fulvus]KAA2253093.1 hypothetical protein F0L68_33630 [Solihabitans fulvus]
MSVMLQDRTADLVAGYENYTTAQELTLAVAEGYEDLVAKSTPITITITTTTLIFSCQHD